MADEFASPEPIRIPSGAERKLARLRTEARVRAGADWFFWVAGLALLDVYLNRSGVGTEAAFGLGMTDLAERAAPGWGLDGDWLVAAVGLALPLLFLLLGVLARRGRRWAFLVGMVFYGADGVLLLWSGKLVGVAVHLVLFGLLAIGLAAANQLRHRDNAGAGVMA